MWRRTKLDSRRRRRGRRAALSSAFSRKKERGVATWREGRGDDEMEVERGELRPER